MVEKANIEKWTPRQQKVGNYIYSKLEHRRDNVDRRAGEVEGLNLEQLCHNDWIGPKETSEVLELMHAEGLVSRFDLAQNFGMTYQLKTGARNPFDIIQGENEEAESET
jgi:hypothetical protein